MRLTARVPATAANLGPGFDCFGLALDLCNEFTVDTDAEPVITWEGEGAGELPTDGSDMVSRAMRQFAEDANERLPAVALSGRNVIPLERGLGSSASACVAGIALASRLLGLDHPLEADISMASFLEGHPDNVAAATLGGLTIAWSQFDAIRLDVAAGVHPTVLVPEGLRLSTSAARLQLPEALSRDDAVHNISRAALAVVAFTDRPDLLADALSDRLHQGVRLARVPEAREIFELVQQAGVPICVAGSGPSLLAFPPDGQEIPDPGDGWRVLRVPVRAEGVEILEA